MLCGCGGVVRGIYPHALSFGGLGGLTRNFANFVTAQRRECALRSQPNTTDKLIGSPSLNNFAVTINHLLKEKCKS